MSDEPNDELSEASDPALDQADSLESAVDASESSAIPKPAKPSKSLKLAKLSEALKAEKAKAKAQANLPEVEDPPAADDDLPDPEPEDDLSEPSDLPDLDEPAPGLSEETAPSEAIEDGLDAPASRSQPLVIRGIADLEAEEASKSGSISIQPREMSADSSDDERTAPGLRIPTNPATPVVAPLPAKPARAPGVAGVGTAPLSLDAVSNSSQSLNAASSSSQSLNAEFPFAAGNAAPKKTMAVGKRLVIVVVVALVAFSLMAWFIVSQWLPPATALMMMVGGVLLPTTVIAHVLSAGSTRGTIVRILPALVLSAAAIAAGWSWNLDHIRAQAVPFAPNQIRTMEQMFADQSIDLSLAACRRYSANSTDPAWWNALFAVLYARPDLATSCLKDKQMPAEVRERIGGALLDKWGGDLVEEGTTLPEARACQISNGLRELPVPIEESSARLLNCNLTATKPAVQKCCGRSLADSVENSSEWASRVPAVLAAAKTDRVASGAFAMAFHGQGLSPEQVEFVDSVKFNKFEAQRTTLQVACPMIPKKQGDTVQHLRAALDEHCDMGVNEMPKGSGEWLEICNTAVEQLKQGKDLSPMSTLCSLTAQVSVPDAVAAAQKLVRKATPSPVP